MGPTATAHRVVETYELYAEGKISFAAPDGSLTYEKGRELGNAMSRIGPVQFRINHLLLLVACCAVVLALLKHALDLESVSRSWYLTLLAFILPRTSLALVRASMPPRPLRDRLTLVLKWLPVWLVLGLLMFHESLGLNEEFWLTPLVCICVFAVPPIVAVKLLRALKARFP